MQEAYKDDEIEIDLRELFFELLAHWKMICLSMVMVGVIAFTASKFLMTPMYESTAELYVLTKSTSITSLADIQTGTNLTNDYMVVVKGRPVLEQVIKNLELEETYGQLSDNVTLNNPSNSRILQITVQDPDPRRAKTIADEIADVSAAFISEKMDQDPPTVIQHGYADGSPVSPSIPKNTVIGALVGAVVAMAIVILSYLLNDSIMTGEDVEKKLGLNLLGTLPLEEAEADNAEASTTKSSFKKKTKKKTKKQSA